MTDIPDELVEQVQRIIFQAMSGRSLSEDAARLAIRAVLDWQALKAGGE